LCHWVSNQRQFFQVVVVVLGPGFWDFIFYLLFSLFLLFYSFFSFFLDLNCEVQWQWCSRLDCVPHFTAQAPVQVLALRVVSSWRYWGKDQVHETTLPRCFTISDTLIWKNANHDQSPKR
jgi:hypothetical protein